MIAYTNISTSIRINFISYYIFIIANIIGYYFI